MLIPHTPEMSITRFQDKGGIVDLGIKGKKVLVTGTGRGLGYAIALTLAEEGAKVAAISRKRENLDKLMEEIGGTENGHYVIVCNLAEEGAPQKILEELNDNFGFIDILVNNLGGTLDIVDPLCSIQDWRDIFRFNLEVAIELNNLVIPKMKELGWGRIVNICSTASMENNGPVTYCTVKAAFLAYTRCMGRVLAKDGIVMSAVLPGAINTEGGHWEKALKERPEHAKKYLEERCPLGRFGNSRDIGYMVAFLSSNLAEFSQGSIIPVDGGQSRHFFSQ